VERASSGEKPRERDIENKEREREKRKKSIDGHMYERLPGNGRAGTFSRKRRKRAPIAARFAHGEPKESFVSTPNLWDYPLGSGGKRE